MPWLELIASILASAGCLILAYDYLRFARINKEWQLQDLGYGLLWGASAVGAWVCYGFIS